LGSNPAETKEWIIIFLSNSLTNSFFIFKTLFCHGCSLTLSTFSVQTVAKVCKRKRNKSFIQADFFTKNRFNKTDLSCSTVPENSSIFEQRLLNRTKEDFYSYIAACKTRRSSRARVKDIRKKLVHAYNSQSVIFAETLLGVARFFLIRCTKTRKNIPKDTKTRKNIPKDTKTRKNIPNDHEIYQHFPL
jgi:hypothetical protein